MMILSKQHRFIYIYKSLGNRIGTSISIALFNSSNQHVPHEIELFSFNTRLTTRPENKSFQLNYYEAASEIAVDRKGAISLSTAICESRTLFCTVQIFNQLLCTSRRLHKLKTIKHSTSV